MSMFVTCNACGATWDMASGLHICPRMAFYGQPTTEDLARRLTDLEARVAELTRAAIAHAGDLTAHPCSCNSALEILRTIEPATLHKRPDSGEGA